MDKYVVKFNNYQANPAGTGRLHYQVLKEHGKVIWGQWRKGDTLLSEKRRTIMNQAPFIFYALDREIALLKMTVEHVYTREEVIESRLEYLIPSYYSIDTPCSAYYLITNIEILPPEESARLVSSSGKIVYNHKGQISSVAPWQVTETDDEIILTKPIEEKVEVTPKTTSDKVFSVYRYHCPKLGKSYIGMTCDIERRRREHENHAVGKSKKFLYTMMDMLGLEEFEFEVLHTGLTEEEAHYWEAKEIENHNSYYPNGFNERNETRYLKQGG